MKEKFEHLLDNTKKLTDKNSLLNKTFAVKLFNTPPWFIYDHETFKTYSTKTEKTHSTHKPKAQVEFKDKKVEDSKVKDNSRIKILFFSDIPIEVPEQLELVNKIVSAMKLNKNEFTFNWSRPDKSYSDLMSKLKPKVVVAFGANSCNLLLNTNEKLSNIHGQFLTRSITDNDQSFDYIICPIFHPSFLIQNPNMKRRAWTALQKVMEIC